MSLPDRTLCWVEGPPWDRNCTPADATPSRPLAELTDDELEFVRLTSERPMNIPAALAPAAERLRSLVQEEQVRR